MTDVSPASFDSSPCGKAVTLDDDDGPAATHGLQAARAMRRALADARRKAAEVGGVWACRGDSVSEAAVRHVIELAMGRFAGHVEVTISPLTGAPEHAFEEAARRASAAVATGRYHVSLAVSVGVGGRNVALAFCAEP